VSLQGKKIQGTQTQRNNQNSQKQTNKNEPIEINKEIKEPTKFREICREIQNLERSRGIWERKEFGKINMENTDNKVAVRGNKS